MLEINKIHNMECPKCKTKVNAQTSNEGELCDNCYYEKSNGVKGLGKAISAIKLALDNK